MSAAEEFDFWGKQATEHALFMHLGLEDPALKAEAKRLHDGMKAAYDVRSADRFLPLLDRSMAFKRAVLARLNQGEWLGWLFPLFVDHILREEEYFKAKLAGSPIPPGLEAATWIRFMAEHAEFAAHLVDPSEKAAFMQALALAGDLGKIGAACAGSCSPQMIALSARKGIELDRFFSGMKPAQPRSVIHPALAAHVVREGRRFVQTMNGLLTQPLVRAPAGRLIVRNP